MWNHFHFQIPYCLKIKNSYNTLCFSNAQTNYTSIQTQTELPNIVLYLQKYKLQTLKYVNTVLKQVKYY